MNTTSVSLLDRLRERPDADSWQRFVQLYEPWLRGQLHRYDLERFDVDDILQDVMTVLVKEVAGFRHNGRPGAFRTWLRGITVNRLREFWRERRQLPTAEGSDPDRILDQLADDHSELSQIRSEERRVGKECRL